MRAVEFEGIVASGGNIVLPPEIANAIPSGEPLIVVVMWQPSEVESGWRTAGRQRFEAAYSAEDDMYDSLMDDTAVR